MAEILILGAGGQLGRAWQELLAAEGQSFEAWDRAQFTLGNPEHLKRLDAAADCKLIVNCGAYTQVDKAETEYDQASLINGTATGQLAQCAAKLGARLIHYSTDYVFDGKASEPYPVDEMLNPINAYGRSKAEGEQQLKDSGAKYLLLRTSWVYAPWGKNFVLTMARLIKEKPELRVVGDQVGRPSSALQLARRSWQLCQKAESGTFHVTDAGQCSWYEFAVAIRDALGLQTPITAIPTEAYPTPAVRPPYSVLDTSATDALLGPGQPWQEALHEVLERLASE